jgi:hypothetical protein
MDIVGPSQVRSMGGKWYVLVIVDDYSHYSWVFFLESKDEVFKHFWILNLTPFELRFGCKPSIYHLKPFGCKCFVLKCGNLDKFESHSSDDILLGYTPCGRSYRVFRLETNTIAESYDVTFDQTAPCPRDVFEFTGDKEMEEIIFIDEELQGIDSDEDEPLHPSTPSPELVPASTLEAEAPQATISSTAAVEAS